MGVQVLKFVADHSDISVQNGGERLADALRQVLCPGEEPNDAFREPNMT